MTFAGKFKPQSLAPRKGSASARPALDCIEANSPLGFILQKAESSLNLQRAINLSLNKNGLERAIPYIRVGSFSKDNGQLKLFTANSAVAARLQQKLPSILFSVQEQGWAVQNLVIKQAPGGANIESPNEQKGSFSPVIFTEKAQKSWSELLQKLEQNSPLRAAVEKLLKNK
jgi:hypothetical protein